MLYNNFGCSKRLDKNATIRIKKSSCTISAFQLVQSNTNWLKTTTVTLGKGVKNVQSYK